MCTAFASYRGGIYADTYSGQTGISRKALDRDGLHARAARRRDHRRDRGDGHMGLYLITPPGGRPSSVPGEFQVA